ncbi:MAG: acetylglutamate kinase [Thermodesulfovibrio sp. RBG_19FT_COMBO_42_12]|nr:MAG: acetylglutamate kinase [Thermodesulfovibrio sp. RBG_19FT_COMBO_42_12]
MKDIITKAEILIEALPYIRNFYGKTFVIKYGGSAQLKEKLKESFAKDIVMLNFIGIRTAIVHGGGPRISAVMGKMGKKPEFIQGQRVTDKETMDIVEMVLGGLVNKEIVSLINSHGGKAVGLSGKDGGFIEAKKKMIKKTAEKGVEEIIDIGLVGEVTHVDPHILMSLEKDGFIPVISPIGVGSKGETLNINADYVAASIASALKAEKLIILTDVPGIMDKNNKIISTLTKQNIKKYIKEGTIKGGMLPKVQACVKATEGGVSKTHIIDGRVPHCLLLEIFTKKGIGTEILA